MFIGHILIGIYYGYPLGQEVGMRHKYVLFLIVFICFSCDSPKNDHDSESSSPDLSGPYLGQTPPGDSALLFAPGFISTALYSRDIAMTPDGNEIYFCVSTMGLNLIFFTRQIEGKWTEPAIAPFISEFDYLYYEPHISPDGSRMFFLSNRPPVEGKKMNEDIWVVDRMGDSWGKPYNLGYPICTEDAEYFPSTTRNGTLYFSRQKEGEQTTCIYRSALKEGKYQEPEKLGPQVNCGTSRYNAFIDPDEKFIIVPAMGMSDSRGGTDYYIVFRDKNGNWQSPVNMGDRINTPSGREYSPYISPDGRYFFFMSSKTFKGNESSPADLSYTDLLAQQCGPLNGNASIYWINTAFIDRLKPKGLAQN